MLNADKLYPLELSTEQAEPFPECPLLQELWLLWEQVTFSIADTGFLVQELLYGKAPFCFIIIIIFMELWKKNQQLDHQSNDAIFGSFLLSVNFYFPLFVSGPQVLE